MTPIAEFIARNHLTQTKVSEYLKISSAAVSQLCSGKNNPSPQTLEKLINNDQGWKVGMLRDLYDFGRAVDLNIEINANARGAMAALNAEAPVINNDEIPNNYNITGEQVKTLKQRIRDLEDQVAFLQKQVTDYKGLYDDSKQRAERYLQMLENTLNTK